MSNTRENNIVLDKNHKCHKKNVDHIEQIGGENILEQKLNLVKVSLYKITYF